jgi:hypothetical protein
VIPRSEAPRTAFKEWAVICRALAAGRQDVILRKGGIAEPSGGFRVDCNSFLLLPTFIHQGADAIVPSARDLLLGIDADRPPPGTVVFTHAASVSAVTRITCLADLDRFRDRHVWADAVVAERFHRWQNELHVLEVTVAALGSPRVVPWHEDYGGCKSWVALRGDRA